MSSDQLLVRDRSDYLTSRYSERREDNEARFKADALVAEAMSQHQKAKCGCTSC